MSRDRLIARAREAHPVAAVAAAAGVTERTVYRAQRRAEPAEHLSPDDALAHLAELSAPADGAELFADSPGDSDGHDVTTQGGRSRNESSAGIDADPETDGHDGDSPAVARMRAAVEQLAAALEARSAAVQVRYRSRVETLRLLLDLIAENGADATTLREWNRNLAVLEHGLESATTARVADLAAAENVVPLRPPAEAEPAEPAQFHVQPTEAQLDRYRAYDEI